jgi:hypothetical protein
MGLIYKDEESVSREIHHMIWEFFFFPFGPPDRQKALENRVMTTAEKTFKLEL